MVGGNGLLFFLGGGGETVEYTTTGLQISSRCRRKPADISNSPAVIGRKSRQIF